jgi:hypothetical protein
LPMPGKSGIAWATTDAITPDMMTNQQCGAATA